MPMKEQRPPDSEGADTGFLLLQEEFPADPSSARHARHLVAEICTEQDLPSVLEAATLCTAEIVTNAIRYGGAGTVRLRVTRFGCTLQVEVEDDNATLPAIHSPEPEDPSGRGLVIVSALAQDWGSKRNRRGKSVWFTVSATDDFAQAS